MKNIKSAHFDIKNLSCEINGNNVELLHNALHPVVIYGIDTSIIYVNPSFEEYSGFSLAEIGGMKAPYPFWTSETKYKSKDALISIFQKRHKKYEETYQRKNRSKMIVEMNFAPIIIDGEIKYIISNWIDVTERIQYHKALQDSEEFSANLLDYSPNPILVINSDTSIKYINNAFVDLTGFTKDTLIGQKAPYPWWLPETMQQNNDALLDVMNTGEWKEEKHVITRDDKCIWIEISTIAVGEQNTDKYFISNWVDITERKNAEANLVKLNDELRRLSAHLEHIRENERTHIAREIHDELGQALASLKMDVCWLAENLEGTPIPLKIVLSNMTKLIDVTVQKVKRLCLELRPRLLDDIGLAGTIEWLGEEFQKTAGIKCKVYCSIAENVLDSNKTSAIFRIFQAALANVYQHSNATRIRVSLRQRGKWIMLTVFDNGKGITIEQVSSPKSFGLLGMRERARFLGGDIEVKSNPGSGTKLIVKIPVNIGGEENV